MRIFHHVRYCFKKLLNIAEEIEIDQTVIITPTISSGNYIIQTTEGYFLQLAVYNAQGQMVQQISDRSSGQHLALDLTAQPAGIYFVRVWLDGKYKVSKKIKME